MVDSETPKKKKYNRRRKPHYAVHKWITIQKQEVSRSKYEPPCIDLIIDWEPVKHKVEDWELEDLDY